MTAYLRIKARNAPFILREGARLLTMYPWLAPSGHERWHAEADGLPARTPHARGVR